MSSTQAKNKKILYAKRKESGLCTKCGQPLDGKWTVCTKCHNDYYETKEFYEKHNLCRRCGKNKVYGTDRYCFECRAYYNEYNRKYIENSPQDRKEKYKKRRSEQRKEVYYRLKEQGICVCCRKRKALPGKVSCGVCSEKNKLVKELKRNPKQNTFEYRLENGLCYFCGEPLKDKTKTICLKCHEKRVEIGKERAKLNKNWRNDNKIIFKN